jgi:hypothetical protein
MARRRSHPPRARKGRNAESEAPPQQQDVAVAVSQPESITELVREVAPASPVDELAALDAGWDEIS